MTTKLLVPVFALFLLTACSSIQTVTPAPEMPAALTAEALFAETLSAGAPDGSNLPMPPLGQTDPAPAPVSPIWLSILSPIDEAVVNTPQIEVIGEAAAGAVVSVNEQILIVGADQKFTALVALDEGPNLIEIVASDALGGEITLELVVIYEP